MHFYKMRNIVNSITYKPGWSIHLKLDSPDSEGRPYIQISVSTEAEASLSPGS